MNRIRGLAAQFLTGRAGKLAVAGLAIAAGAGPALATAEDPTGPSTLTLAFPFTLTELTDKIRTMGTTAVLVTIGLILPFMLVWRVFWRGTGKI